MKIIIKAKPKEIAALLLEIETQQNRCIQCQGIERMGGYKNLDSENALTENFDSAK